MMYPSKQTSANGFATIGFFLTDLHTEMEELRLFLPAASFGLFPADNKVSAASFVKSRRLPCSFLGTSSWSENRL